MVRSSDTEYFPLSKKNITICQGKPALIAKIRDNRRKMLILRRRAVVPLGVVKNIFITIVICKNTLSLSLWILLSDIKGCPFQI